MRPKLTFLLLLASLFFACQSDKNNQQGNHHNTSVIQPTTMDTLEITAWDSIFKERGVEGTFVLYYPDQFQVKVHNPARAAKRFCPASTFKIYNSLISLQERAVKDVDELIEWDGIKRSFNAWNRDYTMRDGMRNSCLWFYQELARRNGKATMQRYLDTIPYGNATIGSEVDQFWVDGSLQISAYEQVAYVYRLSQKELPFSRGVQDTVEMIMQVDSTSTYQIHAKTGWSIVEGQDLGWFVGYAKHKGKIAVFAINIDMQGMKDVKFRQDISYAILRSEGWID